MVPFCKARVDSPQPLYLCPDSEEEYSIADAIAFLRAEIKSRRNQILEFALCSETYGRRDEEIYETRFLKVEFQDTTSDETSDGIYYFPILTDAGKLTVRTYDRFDMVEKIL